VARTLVSAAPRLISALGPEAVTSRPSPVSTPRFTSRPSPVSRCQQNELLPRGTVKRVTPRFPDPFSDPCKWQGDGVQRVLIWKMPNCWNWLRVQSLFTEDELARLCKGITSTVVFSNPSVSDVVHVRVSIELIRAIWRFDKASGEMVKQGNRINTYVLIFAVLAVILGGASIWISWLSYTK
jgi:hypothetical protein